jgi:hypothetical protein
VTAAAAVLRRATASLALAAALCACGAMPQRQLAPSASAHVAGADLRFIGEQRLGWRLPFRDTVVGGLSGIDYNPVTGVWVLASDDRSDVNPARFYTARLDYDADAFKSVTLTGVHFFRQENGSLYPNAAMQARAGGEVPDIETIRYDPLDGSLWYGSEGSRQLGFQPFVRHASADGGYLGTLAAPPMLRVWPARDYGVRDNLAFEGISFAPDGRSLWLGMEAPLYQDGPLPTTAAGAPARISHVDRDGKLLRQYAYPVDAIPQAPAPGKLADNGVAEILAIDAEHVYVLERSGTQDEAGNFSFHIRLYEMAIAGATDVSHLPALAGADYMPARKRLVLDFDTLPLARIDNIEGIAWGARLANGHDALVLVSDDNFNRGEVTQLLLFEVLPK